MHTDAKFLQLLEVLIELMILRQGLISGVLNTQFFAGRAGLRIHQSLWQYNYIMCKYN